ncbi:hypothetical protein NESM_000177400 [Novymonas esmeraldas]|uniref:Uncharacterized protein n=1 Tax=Novymonas esmeraldas TaxID=1808958 RepID=A0AAW0F800_9TRYP
MRDGRVRVGLRRLRGWAAAPRRAGLSAVWEHRRCCHGSTASRSGTGCSGGAEAASLSSPAAAPPVSLPHQAEPETVTTSSTATLFDYFLGDVASTLDVAPIKRPHLVGSLLCSLDEYPVSIVLVEDCCGTSTEAVVSRVRLDAVASARLLKAASRKSAKAFLHHHFCTTRPSMMRLLDALDLSLRVRLLRRETGPDAAGDTAEDAERAVDGTGTGTAATAAGTARAQVWRCSAALYDPWHTQPRFSPVAAGGSDAASGASEEEVGELVDVVATVLAAVEDRLRQLRAEHLTAAVEEASRFLRGVGDDLCDTSLTRRCIGAVGDDRGSSAALRRCRWWGQTRASPSWSLTCSADADDERATAVALRLGVSHAQHVTAPPGVGDAVAVLLHDTHVRRGLVNLIDGATADGMVRHYRGVSDVRDALQDVYLVSDLASRIARGDVKLATTWRCGPMDLTQHLLATVAALSPTVAYEWIGRSAPGDDAPCAGLPLCVRWSTYAGRTNLEDYLAAQDDDATGQDTPRRGCVLPPLWPQVGLVRLNTVAGHYAAFAELIRHEHGVRGVPRATVAVPAGDALPLECEAAVVAVRPGGSDGAAAAATATTATTGFEVLCGRVYATIADAAGAHTPWATPLLALRCPSSSPSSSTAVRASGTRGSRSHASNIAAPPPRTCAVSMLSITASLLARNITGAMWNGQTLTLTEHTRSGDDVATFNRLDRVSGCDRLLRYCARRGVFKTVHVHYGLTTRETLQRLLTAVASGAASDAEEAGGEESGGCGGGGSGASAADTHAPRQRRLNGARESGALARSLVFPLPFNAGAVRLTLLGGAEAMPDLQPAANMLLRHCKTPEQLTALLAAAACERAAPVTTFFHTWPLTAKWVAADGGALRASLTRVLAEDNAAVQSTGSSTASRAGAAVYELRLSAVPSPTSGQRKFRAAGAASTPPTTTTTVTRLPTGSAWLSTAFAAIRAALMEARPELFDRPPPPPLSSSSSPSASAHRRVRKPSTGEDGEEEEEGKDYTAAGRHWLLVYCSSFAQACEACLYFAVPVNQLQQQERRLLTHLLGSGARFQRTGDSLALELDVAPLMPPIHLLSASTAVDADGSPHGSIWAALLQTVIDAWCPSARAAVEAAALLLRRLAAVDEKRAKAEPLLRCRLASTWVPRRATAAGGGPVQWVRTVSAELRQSAAGGGAERRVLHREEGTDAFVVLWRLLHCAALHHPSTAGASASAAAAVGALQPPSWSFIAHPPRRFVEAALASLARQHKVARATCRYDGAKGCVVVEGWEAPLCHGAAGAVVESAAAPRVLEELPMPLDCVPRRLLRRLHQLLTGASEAPHLTDALWREMSAQRWNVPTSVLVDALCKTLGCEPGDLRDVEVRLGKVWSARLVLPLRLFGITVSPSTATGADTPTAVCLYCYHASKKSAARSVHQLLYDWVLHPQCKSFSSDVQFCVEAHNPTALRNAAWPQSPTTLPSKTRVVQRAAKALPAPRARTSILDAAHSRAESLLGDLVGDKGGRVVLRLSQTFGFVMEYGAPTARQPQVQLWREGWVPEVWAPAQILSAGVVVLQRLLSGVASGVECGAVLGELLTSGSAASLPALQGGPAVRAKDFCVSFFRRYFGWRVCEREDLGEMTTDAAHSDVVLVQIICAAPPSRGRGRGRQPSRHVGSLHKDTKAPVSYQTVHVTLQLMQLSPGTASGARLAQVVGQAQGPTSQTALDALWVQCADKIKSVFAVSHKSSTADADAHMLAFMRSQIE